MSKSPRVLLVCTGNTCRSPLAEVMLGQLRPDWEVRSAGVHTEEGLPASQHSQQVAGDLGLDLAQHRSRPVTAELVAWPDHILCLTEAHRQRLVSLFPEAQERSRRLGSSDIPDPVGQPLERYRACALAIENALQEWLSDRL